MIINTIKGSIFMFPLLSYSLIYFNLIEYIADPELYPSSWKIFKDVMFISFVSESFFYWLHRLFHTSYLYKKFHKQHHEYQLAVSIAAIYNHPFDYLITNVMPGLLARVLLGRFHVITAYMWSFYAITFAHFVHCGYAVPWFPWSVFPFGSDIDYHDYHHSNNAGNFGSVTTFWDSICGTNKQFWNSVHRKEEKKYLE